MTTFTSSAGPEPVAEPPAVQVAGDVPPAFGLLQELASPPKSGRGRWILGGGGLAVVGCLLWPVSTRIDVTCQLEPVSLAAAVAPRDGEIVSRPVASGLPVKAEQVLATLATDQLKKQLAEAERQLSGGRAKVDRLRHKARVAAGAKLKRKLDVRKKALDKALALQAKWTAADASASQKQQLAKANHQVAAAQAAFKALDKKYQALTGEVAIASLQDRITLDQAEVQRLQADISASAISAPAAGIFLRASEASGSHVAKDQPYGRIVKPDALHLTASPPAAASKGDLAAAVLVLPEEQKGTLQGLAWMEGPGDPKLEATIDSAAPGPGPQTFATLQIPTGLRPLLWKLLQ